MNAFFAIKSRNLILRYEYRGNSGPRLRFALGRLGPVNFFAWVCFFRFFVPVFWPVLAKNGGGGMSTGQKSDGFLAGDRAVPARRIFTRRIGDFWAMQRLKKIRFLCFLVLDDKIVIFVTKKSAKNAL